MKRTALMLVGLLLCTGGCAVDEMPAPDYRSPLPPHPYVVRTYHYYPDAEVYLDPARDVYFWRDPSGAWMNGRRLPNRVRPSMSRFVEVTIDTDEPYRTHERVAHDHPKSGN